MTTQPNDGGPAFPRPTYVELDENQHRPEKGKITCDEGMSLRDWFAGHALAGFLANQEAARSVVLAASTHHEANRSFAETAYGLADAMLAARSSREG